jgi:hypothetical protein
MSCILKVIMKPTIAVGLANDYELDDRGVAVRVPVGVRFFSLPLFPDRFWSPPSLLPKAYRVLFRRGKAAGL